MVATAVEEEEAMVSAGDKENEEEEEIPEHTISSYLYTS